MNAIPFVDYSQYYAWLKCPWLWYERTVNKRQKAWPSHQRSDPLAIGSLVHSGLETWARDHKIEIPEATIAEFTPTPEALTMCKTMVLGYTRAFPQEHWSRVFVEQPLRFPLVQQNITQACGGCGWWLSDCPTLEEDCPACGSKHITTAADQTQIDGLAKIDCWFEVSEQTTIESGIDGYPCTLTPGIWIHEYKTKADSISMNLFMRKWEVNRQASFQTLALQSALGYPIQGVLVNVIEKPRVYIPRRKCRGCSQQFELPSWLPGEGAESICPSCSTAQVLNKGNTSPTYSNPRYYRFPVHRSAATLQTHKAEIATIAQAMAAARTNGLSSLIPNSEACVDTRFGECEYFNSHVYENSTLEDPQFINIPDYVNEPQSV